MNVHNTIHNNQKVKITQCSSADEWINKILCNNKIFEILFGHKKECTDNVL